MRARLLLLAAALAGCGSGPQPKPEEPERPRTGPTVDSLPPTQPVNRMIVPIPGNGLTAVVSEGRPGSQAQIMLGLLAGSVFLAPGAAELAARNLLRTTDPTTGRRSLQQVLEDMAATVSVEVGPTTTWISVRSPQGRWRDVLRALRQALAAPTQSRSQLTRLRDEYVQEQCATIRRDPISRMAELLLQGQPGTGDYVLDLLDRDPSEISLFANRLHRPEQAVLAIELPGKCEETAAALLADQDGIAGWTGQVPLPGSSEMLARRFESGLYWCEAGTPANSPCATAMVLYLPLPAQVSAPELTMIHSCLTLDGTGGRLERLMGEAGLGHLNWQARTITTPDAMALVMRTISTPAEAQRVWQVLQLARQSLRDVPPTRSELALAGRRTALSTRMTLVDERNRLRCATRLGIEGKTLVSLFRYVDELAAAPKIDVAELVESYLAQPAAVIVVGPGLPAELADLRPFELLPRGLGAAAVAASTAPVANGAPWLQVACDAVGGAQELARVTGFTGTATVTPDAGPPWTERSEWRSDGFLLRQRELLGTSIVTMLDGEDCREQLSPRQRNLTPAESHRLRLQMSRHPLMLLAAHARGDLEFRLIARRDVGDRELTIVEALGARYDRLRMHLDSRAGLVRTVESWEQADDGSAVHVREDWSDYRQTGAVRSPFLCRTSRNDGQTRAATSWTEWRATVAP